MIAQRLFQSKLAMDLLVEGIIAPPSLCCLGVASSSFFGGDGRASFHAHSLKPVLLSLLSLKAVSLSFGLSAQPCVFEICFIDHL